MFSKTALISSLFFVAGTFASHSISVVNNCGFGTPTLAGGGLSSPMDISKGYKTNGDLSGFRVYLNNGSSPNGDNVMLVEGTFQSSSSFFDISKVGSHKFNVPTKFTFADGTAGKSCATASCTCNVDAYCQPQDNGALAVDSDPNSSVTITYC